MRDPSECMILVVEDDPAVARLVRWMLESAGFTLHVVGSGREAIRFATEQRPSLVILDVGLPDVNGHIVCRELRRITHPWTVPILMLTGMAQPIDQLRGFAHGADAYLTKPYQPEELTKTVRLLLEETLAA